MAEELLRGPATRLDAANSRWSAILAFVAHALATLDQNLHPDFDNSIAGNPEVFGCVSRPPSQPNE